MTNHLLLMANGAVNNSDVKSFTPCSDCLSISGASAATGSVPGAPKLTWTLSGEYTDHFTGNYNWYGRVDYNHLGKFYVDYTNLAYTNAADLVNVHLGIRDDALLVEGFVKNLTNNSAPLSAQFNVDVLTYLTPPTGNAIHYALPDKRTFGVRMKYKF